MSNENGNSLAAQFRQKAKAARKAINLPVPLASDPDFVFPCILRRIDLVTMVTAPEAGLPEHFVNSILGLRQPEKLAELQGAAANAVTEIAGQMTVDGLQAILKFRKRVAQETCIEPRIVFSKEDAKGAEYQNVGTPMDCIDLDAPEFAHCADEICVALYRYGMKLSPDVPVAMANGTEASLEGIETFPAKPALSNAVHDGEQVQDASV